MLESSKPAAGCLSVTSPFDGRELEQVGTAGQDHVADALSAAHDRYRDRDSWLSAPKRIEILDKNRRQSGLKFSIKLR